MDKVAGFDYIYHNAVELITVDRTYPSGFYHLDETENFIGPFKTLAVVEIALKEYIAALDGEPYG